MGRRRQSGADTIRPGTSEAHAVRDVAGKAAPSKNREEPAANTSTTAPKVLLSGPSPPAVQTPSEMVITKVKSTKSTS